MVIPENLVELFNLSFEKAKIPKSWKKAKVTPLQKVYALVIIYAQTEGNRKLIEKKTLFEQDCIWLLFSGTISQILRRQDIM